MPTINEVLSQGWAVQQQGDHAKAEQIYREVLRQVPNSAPAWCYLGIVLHDQRRFEESETAYRRSIELQPVFPIAWNNLGNTLRMLGRIPEADSAFDTALDQDPGYLSPLKNRGTLCVWTGALDRGLLAYQQGLQLAPEDPELHRNLGVIHLLQGQFQEGWREYRWRWKMPGFARPELDAPLWDRSDLKGKTILLYTEQGLGDTIHFVRMADVLKQRGAYTVVRVAEKMIPLLSSAPGIDQLISDEAQPLGIDFHCSLIDVADFIGVDEESIPSVDGYLSAPENLNVYWRRWLDDVAEGMKIGICWQGNPNHAADVFRSIPLRALEPLAQLDGVSLVCLQHGYGIEQLDEAAFGDRVIRLPEVVDQNAAFLDTAAIIGQLDLVVTSDTSLAHLAGALGAKVWVVLPQVPDWRWGLSGDNTPWYPSMRLFRQQQMLDWEGVFGEVCQSVQDTLTPAQ